MMDPIHVQGLHCRHAIPKILKGIIGVNGLTWKTGAAPAGLEEQRDCVSVHSHQPSRQPLRSRTLLKHTIPRRCTKSCTLKISVCAQLLRQYSLACRGGVEIGGARG